MKELSKYKKTTPVQTRYITEYSNTVIKLFKPNKLNIFTRLQEKFLLIIKENTVKSLFKDYSRPEFLKFTEDSILTVNQRIGRKANDREIQKLDSEYINMLSKVGTREPNASAGKGVPAGSLPKTGQP